MSAHPHDSTPAGSDEPKTPMWLPALGAALFILLGLAWAISPSDTPPVGPVAAAPSSAPAPAPAGVGTAARR